MLREYQEEIHRLKSMLDGKDGDIAGEKVGIGNAVSQSKLSQ